MRKITLLPLAFLLVLALSSAGAQPLDNREELEVYLAIIEDDHEKAAKLLPPLAEKGNVLMQYSLGLLYIKGLGVKKDAFQAARWFEKAWVQGHGEASFNLGILYEAGVGVSRDSVRSSQLFQRAAEQGDKRAAGILAAKYAEGVGVPLDNVSAHVWANIGAAHDDEKAKQLREQLESKMSRTEIVEARRIAREWFSKHRGTKK